MILEQFSAVWPFKMSSTNGNPVFPLNNGINLDGGKYVACFRTFLVFLWPELAVSLLKITMIGLLLLH